MNKLLQTKFSQNCFLLSILKEILTNKGKIFDLPHPNVHAHVNDNIFLVLFEVHNDVAIARFAATNNAALQTTRLRYRLKSFPYFRLSLLHCCSFCSFVFPFLANVVRTLHHLFLLLINYETSISFVASFLPVTTQPLS